MLNFMPADGDHVLCLGRVSLYEPRGECQIIVESLELKGLGGLMRAFEQLKAKLAAEGIFEQRFKKSIPLLPRHVAVITSASGAAIRDILQVIHRRFANLTITVIPVTVQGGGAAAEIVQAIKQCNATLAGQVDTIILARGGGSWEDLAPFNEEIVARAIFSSHIPLISAIGHEVDYTIADAVRTPKHRLGDCRQQLELLSRQLMHVLQQQQQEQRHTLNLLAGKLESCSPLGILQRGYAVVEKLPEQQVIIDAGKLQPGDRLVARFARGKAYCGVQEVSNDKS